MDVDGTGLRAGPRIRPADSPTLVPVGVPALALGRKEAIRDMRRAPGDGRRSATPSLYRTRFQRTGESAAASVPPPPPQPQPPPPPPPEQAWAEEEAEAQAWADEAARDGLLSDKDQRRYEHEQSQMELMQFVEQLRTVRAPRWHPCAAPPGALTACDAGRDGQPVRIPDTHAD